MRIDMTIKLKKGDDCEFVGTSWAGNVEWGYALTLTVEQAKHLRDEITKHLRGTNRDKDTKAEEN